MASTWTEQETKQVIDLLALMAMDVGSEISKPLLILWLKLLKKYPAQWVRDGVLTIIEEQTFKTLPNIGSIIAKIKSMHATTSLPTPEKIAEAKAEAEWDKLLQDIRRLGSYNGPDPKQNKTTQLVLRRMGGWARACQWNESDLHWRRKEFVEDWINCDGKTELYSQGADAIEEYYAHQRIALQSGQEHESLALSFASQKAESLEATQLERQRPTFSDNQGSTLSAQMSEPSQSVAHDAPSTRRVQYTASGDNREPQNVGAIIGNILGRLQSENRTAKSRV